LQALLDRIQVDDAAPVVQPETIYGSSVEAIPERTAGMALEVFDSLRGGNVLFRQS
jgi:hypothetical protein